MLCSKIVPFWNSISDFLGETDGTQIKVSPCVIFFGLTLDQDVQITAVELKFLFYVVLLARREICRLWKSENPPTFSECLRSIFYISESNIACDPKSRENVWAPLTKWREKET